MLKLIYFNFWITSN